MKLCLRVVSLLLFAAALTFVGCKKSEPTAPASEQAPGAAKPGPTDMPAVAKPQAKPVEAEKAPAKPADAKKPAATAPAAAAPKPATPAKEEVAIAADEPAGNQVKTPWADLKVGASVKMKTLNGALSTMEVTKVEGDTVTIRMTLEVPGQAEPVVQETPMPRFMPPAAIEQIDSARGTKAGEETLQIGGKSVVCEVWESKVTVPAGPGQDGGEAATKTITNRTYTNKNVPGQTVRIESDMLGEMQVVMEVVDFKN